MTGYRSTGRKTDSSEEVKSFYDRMWHSCRSKGVSSTLRCYQIMEYAYRYRLHHRPLYIADLRCGRGYLANQLRSLGSVTAVDFAPETIEDNKQRYPQVRFVCADLTDPGLPDNLGSYDLVVTSEVIEHIPLELRDAFLQNTLELLEPDGLLILTTPCLDNILKLKHPDENLAAFMQRFENQPVANLVRKQELEDLLAKHFEILASTSVQPCIAFRPLDLLWKGLFLIVTYRLVNVLTRWFSIPGKYMVLACRKKAQSEC